MAKKQPVFSEEFESNQARYRRACEPHATPEEAEKAVRALYAEIAELRVKYKIKDLYIVYNVALTEKDGSESVASGMTGFGDQALFEPMAACAYGYEKRKREEVIRQMLGDK